MKLAFILVVLVFFLGNPTEAQVPELPANLTALGDYLRKKEASLQNAHQKITETQNKLTSIAGQWPPGHYCILASGSCPAGFTRSQGHMRALQQYAATGAYISENFFGSSSIACHGRCGQYGQWVGDLIIAACCK